MFSGIYLETICWTKAIPGFSNLEHHLRKPTPGSPHLKVRAILKNQRFRPILHRSYLSHHSKEQSTAIIIKTFSIAGSRKTLTGKTRMQNVYGREAVKIKLSNIASLKVRSRVVMDISFATSTSKSVAQRFSKPILEAWQTTNTANGRMVLGSLPSIYSPCSSRQQSTRPLAMTLVGRTSASCTE